MATFELIQLPYAPNALEPVISAETIHFHHGKHLQAYVNNLNGLLPGSGLEEASLEDIVKRSEGGIFNNAGQILNHNLYFTQFHAPQENNIPIGTVAEAIEKQFGSFDAFREEFQKKGVTLFGSGWVWLSADKEGKCLLSTCGNMPTIWIIKTVVLITLPPFGRLLTGRLSNSDTKDKT